MNTYNGMFAVTKNIYLTFVFSSKVDKSIFKLKYVNTLYVQTDKQTKTHAQIHRPTHNSLLKHLQTISYTHTLKHTHTHTHTHIHTHTHKHTHTQIHTHIPICTHACALTLLSHLCIITNYICTDTQNTQHTTHTHMHIHSCICINMYTRTRNNTIKYTHINALSSLPTDLHDTPNVSAIVNISLRMPLHFFDTLPTSCSPSREFTCQNLFHFHTRFSSLRICQRIYNLKF